MTVLSEADELVLPRRMSLEEWSRLDVERPVELVQGVPVVSPYESFENHRTAALVGRFIEDRTARAFVATAQVAVEVSHDPTAPTVRIPDLIITPAAFRHRGSPIPAAAVVLAVEVVSVSSVERDWVTKRAEYAAAGIPMYLVVDRFAGRLVLFDRIVEGRYADPAQDGHVVRLLLGEDPVEVRLADLVG